MLGKAQNGSGAPPADAVESGNQGQKPSSDGSTSVVAPPSDQQAPAPPKQQGGRWHRARSRAVHPNEDWPAIVDDMLGGNARVGPARATMWTDVMRYVVDLARLPLGPLGKDGEARRDVAVRVLWKLEANDYAALREWRRRQKKGKDQSTFWSFVKVLAMHRAIDYVRASPRRTVPRALL